MMSKTRNPRAAAPHDDDQSADPSRRAALKAVGKYAAFLAGSSAVLLSADEALAQQKPCSFFQNKPGNGPPPGRGPQRCRPGN